MEHSDVRYTELLDSGSSASSLSKSVRPNRRRPLVSSGNGCAKTDLKCCTSEAPCPRHVDLLNPSVEGSSEPCSCPTHLGRHPRCRSALVEPHCVALILLCLVSAGPHLFRHTLSAAQLLLQSDRKLAYTPAVHGAVLSSLDAAGLFAALAVGAVYSTSSSPPSLLLGSACIFWTGHFLVFLCVAWASAAPWLLCAAAVAGFGGGLVVIVQRALAAALFPKGTAAAMAAAVFCATLAKLLGRMLPLLSSALETWRRSPVRPTTGGGEVLRRDRSFGGESRQVGDNQHRHSTTLFAISLVLSALSVLAAVVVRLYMRQDRVSILTESTDQEIHSSTGGAQLRSPAFEVVQPCSLEEVPARKSGEAVAFEGLSRTTLSAPVCEDETMPVPSGLDTSVECPREVRLAESEGLSAGKPTPSFIPASSVVGKFLSCPIYNSTRALSRIKLNENGTPLEITSVLKPNAEHNDGKALDPPVEWKGTFPGFSSCCCEFKFPVQFHPGSQCTSIRTKACSSSGPLEIFGDSNVSKYNQRFPVPAAMPWTASVVRVPSPRGGENTPCLSGGACLLLGAEECLSKDSFQVSTRGASLVFKNSCGAACVRGDGGRLPPPFPNRSVSNVQGVVRGDWSATTVEERTGSTQQSTRMPLLDVWRGPLLWNLWQRVRLLTGEYWALAVVHAFLLAAIHCFLNFSSSVFFILYDDNSQAATLHGGVISCEPSAE